MTSLRMAFGISTALVLLARGVPSLAQENGVRRVAAVVTEYRHNSHADVIVSRLLLTDMLDGKGRDRPLKLVSLYTDQKPASDISRLLAASHRFPIKSKIADALTLGTGELAVDGVLLVAEHGDYPFSATGNHQYPKRRFWDETAEVFRKTGKVVPVFIDKHLSDNWEDAKHIYDDARALKVPLMAGSSVSGTWRHPPADVERGAKLTEIVGITYGSTDAYGFHGLEAVQSLAEQRRGGETGVRAVQCLSGEDVWKALDGREVDPVLFRAALARAPGYENGRQIDRKAVKSPEAPSRPSQRRLAGRTVRAERRGGGLDGRLARRRRPVGRLHPVLDAGGAPRRSLRASGRRGPTDDLQREAELAGGAHAPEQRGARRTSALAQARRGVDRDARTLRRVPADLAMEGASAPAAEPPLVGTMNPRPTSLPRLNDSDQEHRPMSRPFAFVRSRGFGVHTGSQLGPWSFRGGGRPVLDGRVHERGRRVPHLPHPVASGHAEGVAPGLLRGAQDRRLGRRRYRPRDASQLTTADGPGGRCRSSTRKAGRSASRSATHAPWWTRRPGRSGSRFAGTTMTFSSHRAWTTVGRGPHPGRSPGRSRNAGWGWYATGPGVGIQLDARAERRPTGDPLRPPRAHRRQGCDVLSCVLQRRPRPILVARRDGRPAHGRMPGRRA